MDVFYHILLKRPQLLNYIKILFQNSNISCMCYLQLIKYKGQQIQEKRILKIQILFTHCYPGLTECGEKNKQSISYSCSLVVLASYVHQVRQVLSSGRVLLLLMGNMVLATYRQGLVMLYFLFRVQTPYLWIWDPCFYLIAYSKPIDLAGLGHCKCGQSCADTLRAGEAVYYLPGPQNAFQGLLQAENNHFVFWLKTGSDNVWPAEGVLRAWESTRSLPSPWNTLWMQLEHSSPRVCRATGCLSPTDLIICGFWLSWEFQEWNLH